MLTSNEKKYLKKIPLSQGASILPFDPKVNDAVKIIENKLKEGGYNWKTICLGSVALGIAGQNDIDFHILCAKSEFPKYAKKVEKLFGNRIPNISIYKWEFSVKGFPVELYLSDPEDPSMKRQLEVFSILEKDKKILKEYESIKQSCRGKSFRYYMKKKYEFYNKILENKDINGKK